MKAVLLARGLGSRMKQEGDAPLTAHQQAAAAAGMKGMMPIGNGRSRPFLDYVLSALADAGCHDICFVVAPDSQQIRNYYDGAGKPSRARLQYAVQPVADGTARAVLCAEGFTGRDAFLVLNADNLYSANVLRTLIHLQEPGLPAYDYASLIAESGFPAARVAAFAALEVDRDGYLSRILEKPGQAYFDTAGPGALISMNVWRFDSRIFEACRAVPRSSRGEYELPEAVSLALARGVRFKTFPASGPVLDLSRRSDVALVSGRLAHLQPQP